VSYILEIIRISLSVSVLYQCSCQYLCYIAYNVRPKIVPLIKSTNKCDFLEYLFFSKQETKMLKQKIFDSEKDLPYTYVFPFIIEN